MWEKIKNYYKNSPKRIGVTLFLIHIIPACILAFLFISSGPNTSLVISFFEMTGSLLLWFPNLFLLPFNSPDAVVNTARSIYCVLVVSMVFFAKDTSSNRFQITKAWFFIFYLMNGAVAAFLLFSLFNIGKGGFSLM